MQLLQLLQSCVTRALSHSLELVHTILFPANATACWNDEVKIFYSTQEDPTQIIVWNLEDKGVEKTLPASAAIEQISGSIQDPAVFFVRYKNLSSLDVYDYETYDKYTDARFELDGKPLDKIQVIDIIATPNEERVFFQTTDKLFQLEKVKFTKKKVVIHVKSTYSFARPVAYNKFVGQSGITLRIICVNEDTNKNEEEAILTPLAVRYRVATTIQRVILVDVFDQKGVAAFAFASVKLPEAGSLLDIGSVIKTSANQKHTIKTDVVFHRKDPEAFMLIQSNKNEPDYFILLYNGVVMIWSVNEVKGDDWVENSQVMLVHQIRAKSGIVAFPAYDPGDDILTYCADGQIHSLSLRF